MAKKVKIHPAYIQLIKVLLEEYDRWEVHSFSVEPDGAFMYGGADIEIFEDGYTAQIFTHDKCNYQHTDCEVEEFNTTDAFEVLEWASANGRRK